MVVLSVLNGLALVLSAAMASHSGEPGPARGQRGQTDAVRVTKAGDREIVVEGTFAVARAAMFEAITEPRI
jgi:hypothetical protein